MGTRMEWEDDGMCFVCGKRNELGLQLDFKRLGDGTIRTELVPSKRFQGFKDVVHGGIIATVLDEVMVNAAYLQGTVAVTSRLEVRLRKPARVGEKLVFQARVQKETSKLLEVGSEARREDGTLIAWGRALLMKVKEREAR